MIPHGDRAPSLGTETEAEERRQRNRRRKGEEAAEERARAVLQEVGWGADRMTVEHGVAAMFANFSEKGRDVIVAAAMRLQEEHHG